MVCLPCWGVGRGRLGARVQPPLKHQTLFPSSLPYKILDPPTVRVLIIEGAIGADARLDGLNQL